MASNSKKVTLKVAVDTEQENIDALDKKLEDTKKKADSLKQQKVQLQVNADTQKLSEVKSKITELENKKTELKVGVDDAEIKATEQEIARLKQEQVRLEVNLEDHRLNELQSKMDAIEADEINVQLNNQTAMEGLQQIADGFSRIKSAASEVGQQFGDLLSSAGKQETNFAFLKNAVGDAELARQKMSEINDIVAQLPGDDTALQGLLSSAAAKDSSLTADNLKSMANSATDYFSAMSYYGKSATEAQQDMTNYLLAGNTAELERSPILQGHIDKLKQATTVQERSKALAEALNEEHWGGMGAMDTYNNKLETFNGMIERGRYTLGGMFQEGAKGAMDFLLKLDESTNGLVGMTIAAGGFLSPVTDALMGLGQMATGINAIKETKLAEWASNVKDKIGGIGDKIKNIDFAGKFNSLKTGLIDIGTKAKGTAISLGSTLKNALMGAATAAKEAAVWIAQTSKELLISAANAMKSAAAWVWEKAVKVASTIATKAMTAAQWLLNIAMSANPVTLIVIAIVALIAILWYLYNTCEPVRNAIDAIWAGVSGAIQPIIDSVQWLIDKLTQLANGDWTVTIEIAKAGASAGVEGFFDVANNDLSRGLFKAIAGDEALAQADEGMGILEEKLKTDINGMLDAIWNDGTQGFLGWLTGIAGIDVNSYLIGLQTAFNNIPLWVNQASQGAIQAFQGMLNGIVTVLNNIITNVINFGNRLVNTISNAARNAWNSFVNSIKGMWKHMAEEVDAILSQADRLLRELPGKLWNAAVNMVRGWLTGSGEGSPGFMYYAFEEDLGAMERISRNNRIADNMGATADQMVNNWGNPQLGMGEGATRTGNGQVVYNFNLYGDVDNEERMQRFVDAVAREIKWVNETAGRNMDL